MRGYSIDDVELYNGFTLKQWVELYLYCHNTDVFGKMHQWCFPNGKSLYEQDNFTIEIFGLIKSQIEVMVKQRKIASGQNTGQK